MEYQDLKVNHPLSNLSRYSFNDRPHPRSYDLQQDMSGFAKARSEENLSYIPRSKQQVNQLHKILPYSPTVHQFGPLGLLKAATDDFSNIVLDVTFGAKQWVKTVSHQSFVMFYHLVHKNYKIPEDIIIPHHVLFAEVDIDVPLDQSQRLFADHIFLFLSEVINSKLFIAEYEIGNNLCMLLDNDFQLLETAYELQKMMKENEGLKLKLNTLNNMDIPVVDDSSNSTPIGDFPKVLDKLMCLKVDQNEGDLRANVFHIVELIVKQVLGCRSFEYSSSLFKTFLPSEPIFISICLNYRKDKADWYKNLIGYLCRLSVLTPKDASTFALGKESSKYTWVKVDHVSFNSREHLILCHINGFNVVISSNEFENLCLYGFYEEFSIRNSHFKEIFALVRAMVFYEMRLYAPKNLEKLLYLDCYLICFVFKAYILILERKSCNIENYLDMIINVFEYLDKLNWTDLLEERNFLIIQKFISTESNIMSRTYSNTILKYQTKWDYALNENEKSSIFLNSILPNKDTKANFAQIQFAMSRLKAFIMRNELCELKISAYLLKDSALHTVTLPFPIHVGNESQIYASIQYFCLVLFSLVEETPLLQLIEEVLFDKGPLPVGEIGKVLQVMTNNTEFTQTLKENFGGLKKLLEQHSHQFYLATDHPYNPKVYITKYLTKDDINDIQQSKPPKAYLSRVCPTVTVSSHEEEGRTQRRRRSRKKKSSNLPMETQIPSQSIPSTAQNSQVAVPRMGLIKGSHTLNDISGILDDDDSFFTGLRMSDNVYSQSAVALSSASHEDENYFLH